MKNMDIYTNQISQDTPEITEGIKPGKTLTNKQLQKKLSAYPDNATVTVIVFSLKLQRSPVSGIDYDKKTNNIEIG